MSEQEIELTCSLTRRAFLHYSLKGLLYSTVIGMVPNIVSGAAYAQSEKKLSNKWLELARQYGEPTNKFGKIGDPVTLTIGYQPYATHSWSALLNKQAKILENYLPPGSQVVWFRALSGPLINNNLLTGKNQWGYMADTPALIAGDMADCVMASVTSYDVGEIGNLCVPIKNGLPKSPQDLEGKTAGVPFGSFAHRQVLTWMEQTGVKLNLTNQSLEQIVSSLRANKIDLAVMWQPYSLWLEHQGIATRWVTGQDMSCSCKKYYPEAVEHTFRSAGSILAVKEWLRDRPDIIAAYLKAEEECRDILNHDLDLATYYIWSDIPEFPKEVVRTALDTVVWDGRITPAIQQHFIGCARMARQKGFLTKERTQNPDSYVAEWADGKFLNLAIQELQVEGWWTSENLPGFPKEVRPDQLQRHHWETYKTSKFEKKSWKRTKT